MTNSVTEQTPLAAISRLGTGLETNSRQIEDIGRLMRFYDAETPSELISAMADHIESLQSKIVERQRAVQKVRFA